MIDDAIKYELSTEFNQLVDSVVLPYAQKNKMNPICLLDYHDGKFEFLYMFFDNSELLLPSLAKRSRRYVGSIPVIFTADLRLSNLSYQRLPGNVIETQDTMIYGGYLIEYEGSFAVGKVVASGWQR